MVRDKCQSLFEEDKVKTEEDLAKCIKAKITEIDKAITEFTQGLANKLWEPDPIEQW